MAGVEFLRHALHVLAGLEKMSIYDNKHCAHLLVNKRFWRWSKSNRTLQKTKCAIITAHNEVSK